MRKLLSIAAFLFISITSYGQLKTPLQTDTLIIKSVEYNNSEILEEKLKRKALFPHSTFPDSASAANARLASRTAKREALFGVATVRSAGRTAIGALPRPTYDAQVSGKVVVKIKVNRDGTVVDAQPGEPGTTLTDKKAWNAVTKAALKIQFDAASDAPEFQYETVTYIFK